jgi:hypothetical protein
MDAQPLGVNVEINTSKKVKNVKLVSKMRKKTLNSLSPPQLIVPLLPFK